MQNLDISNYFISLKKQAYSKLTIICILVTLQLLSLNFTVNAFSHILYQIMLCVR